MKKHIMSPLCSALVVPGLGQITNQNIKKGLVIMAIIFLLLIGGAIKLAIIIRSLFDQTNILQLNPGVLLENLRREDLTSLFYFIIAFAVIWLYSVLDAFIMGKKLESLEENNR